jgi:hypothetical protein
MEKFFNKLKRSIRLFPKKHHVEYVTGLISVPVLLTAIALNIINLQNNTHKVQNPTPTETQKPIIVEISGTQEKQPAPTDVPSCKQEVGPISISYPQEGATVDDNPVCVNIKYTSTSYCSVVWSYKINDGPWSDYNSNSPCLYNVPSGDVKFSLRVQSTVSQDTATLERNFIYKSASNSATTQ